MSLSKTMVKPLPIVYVELFMHTYTHIQPRHVTVSEFIQNRTQVMKTSHLFLVNLKVSVVGMEIGKSRTRFFEPHTTNWMKLTQQA